VRQPKSYDGSLMKIAKTNEDIVLEWLKSSQRSVIDFREFRLAQRIDVDFGVETVDGQMVLAEIKSDRWISSTGNLCFENHRINHFATEHWFYLGWGWRSPAQKLIVRNPYSGDTYVFPFFALRRAVARHIYTLGKRVNILIIETDEQKTTFNYLVPMYDLRGCFRHFVVNQLQGDRNAKNRANR
jgi:hypothetical protein